MARTREFDVDKALEAAMELFWEKGYEATSLQDLTSRMGIQRPSIYAAFGDKQELFEAALRRYTKLHASHVRSSLLNHSSAKQAVRAFFEQLIEEAYSGKPSRGCFCLNTMVELAPHDEKFEILTREHQMYLSVLFQETIEQGIGNGEFEPGMNARAVAKALVVSLIGLTVLMKSRPERSFVEQSLQVILTLL